MAFCGGPLRGPDRRAGVAQGTAAAAVMGVGVTAVDPALRRGSVAGLYGASGSLAAGWLVHLVHGALFGAAFAVVLADPSLGDLGHRFPGALAAGLGYGGCMAVGGMGRIMPMWLRANDVGTTPALPFVTGSPFAWPLVLGALFPTLDGR